MKEEIFKELKKRYEQARFVASLPALMEENDVQIEDEEGNELKPMSNYDVRLLTIFIKNIGERDDEAAPVLQVRVRWLEGEEEEKLEEVAGVIEHISEGLVENFPDKVLVWNWLGD